MRLLEMLRNRAWLSLDSRKVDVAANTAMLPRYIVVYDWLRAKLINKVPFLFFHNAVFAQLMKRGETKSSK